MALPSISVVVPNYNHASYLPHCLNAILSQSVRPNEVIIVDDGSTDNSVEVVLEFAKKDASIKLILNKQNLGVELTNLKGLESATCDYIIFAAADDYLLPGFFEKSLKLLAKHPEAGLCSTLCRRINENEEYLDTVPEVPYMLNSPGYIPPQRMQEIMLTRDNWDIMPSTALYNLKLMKEAKAMPIESGKYADGFAVTLMALNYGACFIPEELGVFRFLSKSASSQARYSPKVFKGYVEPMWDLMETTYSDKFPVELRKCFKRRHLYTYGSMALNQLRSSQEEFLENLKVSLENPSLIDHLFVFGTRLVSKAQYWTTRGYLFIRLRKINLDIILRILNRSKK